jgi:hypothetical protein
LPTTVPGYARGLQREESFARPRNQNTQQDRAARQEEGGATAERADHETTIHRMLSKADRT